MKNKHLCSAVAVPWRLPCSFVLASLSATLCSTDNPMNATTPVVRTDNLRFLRGKTIQEVRKSVNQVEIRFTDGQEIRLEAETEYGCPAVVPYVPAE